VDQWENAQSPFALIKIMYCCLKLPFALYYSKILTQEVLQNIVNLIPEVAPLEDTDETEAIREVYFQFYRYV
jgi:hypothetical protein